MNSNVLVRNNVQVLGHGAQLLMFAHGFDGKHLFFSLLQFEAPPNNGLFFKAVSLQDGGIETLCRVGSVRGLDWHDESVPAPALQSQPQQSTQQQQQTQKRASSAR